MGIVEPLFQRSQHSSPGTGRQQARGGSSEASRGASSGSELKRVVDAAAQRVDEIVDGAEQVASQIIAEAEADATQYLDTRRREVEQVIDEWSADLSGLADVLTRQENRLRRLTDEMVSELEEIAGVLRRIPPEMNRWRETSPEWSSSAEPGGSEQGALLDPSHPGVDQEREAEVEAETSESEPAPGPDSAGHENAMLRAAQMAVGGNSREEIEQALRNELAISDPAPIVDELFGPRT